MKPGHRLFRLPAKRISETLELPSCLFMTFCELEAEYCLDAGGIDVSHDPTAVAAWERDYSSGAG